MNQYAPTGATTPTRLRERVSYDRAEVHADLDEAMVCHAGFVIDGEPVVLPQLHVRVGEVLYLHGSTGARSMHAARGAGLPVCVTVTLLDGLVLARSALNHSVNYRSVVIHGVATEVTDDVEKRAALSALVDAMVPGRSAQVRGPSRKELASTTVLRVPLEVVSRKRRAGGPQDEDADRDLPHWAGVLPLAGPVPGPPLPADDLAAGIEVPDHIRTWTRGAMRA